MTQHTILSRLMGEMIKYDSGDVKRIQHLVKVHDFARIIGIAEGMNEEELFVLEAAAILHDVGIKRNTETVAASIRKNLDQMKPEKYCPELKVSVTNR